VSRKRIRLLPFYVYLALNWYTIAMKLVSNIHYTDAYYISEPVESPVTKLPHNEAFGFVKKGTDESIIISFIRKSDDGEDGEGYGPNHIVRGLIIPESALLSRQNDYLEELKSLKTSERVAVTWKDVVHVANMSRNSSSIMYTEGLLVNNHSDHIVLKDPETIKTHPTPVKNHPPVQPFYYVIPKSAITRFEYIHR